MARDIPCDGECGSVADVMISQLANGDTVALCGGCLGRWAKVLLDTIGIPHEEPTADEIMANTMADDSPDNGQVPKSSGRNRHRTRTTTTTADEAQPEQPEAPPTGDESGDRSVELRPDVGEPLPS